MFDDLFHDPFDYSSVDSMRTDIVEKDDQYMLNMELPGYKPNFRCFIITSKYSSVFIHWSTVP